MAQTIIDSDQHVRGTSSCVTLAIPAGTILDAAVGASAAIQAKKVVRHQSIDVELFGPATTITALSKDIHIVRGATGTLIGFEIACCGTIATGADRTVTVDLHKSTGAGAFATVLSATAGLTNVSVLRTAVAATISGTSLVDGDILRIIVTVAGSASAQALGLIATCTYEETWT